MRFRELVDTSMAVRATRSRKRKVELLAGCLRAMDRGELAIGACYLAGLLPQGKIGVGYAAVREVMGAVVEPGDGAIELVEVDRRLSEIGAIAGAGSKRARADALGGLMARLGVDGRRVLAGLVLGEVRQGASEGVAVEAVAAAFACDAERVRRALMLAGDLGQVAVAAAGGGDAALGRFSIAIFRPLQPMLAQPVADVSAVFGVHGEAAFELKLDGARVQAHKQGDEVRVYSRQLNDVSAAVPEVIEVVRALPAERAILDGETISLRADGAPHPFQTTMRRFGRRADVAAMRESLPLSVFFFDLLHVDGDDLLDEPLRRRSDVLEQLVPDEARVERTVTADPIAADALWGDANRRGHEGLMAKSLDAPYAAGGRGNAWLKLKSAHTLDLVVLAAEWGSGRRRGWLSNLHLGARDPGGGFVMLGKTFKGLTDAVLEWQTTELLARETARDGHVVHVRPELVVEIAFNDVQESPHYPGGMALRFARVKRYRADKTAAEADTIDTVRAIFDGGRRAAG